MDASAEDGGAAVAGALEHLHELTRAALGGVDGDELWGLACERAADALGARWAVRAEPDAEGALISGVGLLEPGSIAVAPDGSVPLAAEAVQVPVEGTGSVLVVGWDRAGGAGSVGRAVAGELGEILSTALQRSRAERQVAESEQRLAEAQELARLGSYDWNMVTDTNTWSDELYRIYGHEPGAFNASYDRFIAMVHPDDRDHVRAVHAQALEDGQPYRMEERIVRPDGEVRTLDSTGKLVVDERGNPLRFVGICLDVTEQRRAAEALRESEERAAEVGRRLREIEQRRTQASEINDNVVQGLASVVYALEEGQVDAALTAARATIAAAAAMMGGLLDDEGSGLAPGDLVRDRAAPSVLAPDAVEPGPHHEPPGGEPLSVLVADDCADVRLLYRLLLENRGIKVVAEAEDGIEAVRLALQTQPDLALIDLAMPGLDGLQVTAELKRLLPECPVVILSGFEASLAGEQAREAGADRYLCKGVDPDTIVSVLYEVRAQRAGTLR